LQFNTTAIPYSTSVKSSSLLEIIAATLLGICNPVLLSSNLQFDTTEISYTTSVKSSSLLEIIAATLLGICNPLLAILEFAIRHYSNSMYYLRTVFLPSGNNRQFPFPLKAFKELETLTFDQPSHGFC
jgi:Na+-transporting NADH:ubiquinone oxidoreductase subunit NqrE